MFTLDDANVLPVVRKIVKGVPFVNRRYKKEVPFLPIWYIKG